MFKEITEQLDRIEALTSIGAKGVLNVDEVCLYTGLSKSRIYSLCSAHKIPHYKQGKIYFSKKELEQWLTSHKVITTAEAESKATLHSLNSPRKEA